MADEKKKLSWKGIKQSFAKGYGYKEKTPEELKAEKKAQKERSEKMQALEEQVKKERDERAKSGFATLPGFEDIKTPAEKELEAMQEEDKLRAQAIEAEKKEKTAVEKVSQQSGEFLKGVTSSFGSGLFSEAFTEIGKDLLGIERDSVVDFKPTKSSGGKKDKSSKTDKTTTAKTDKTTAKPGDNADVVKAINSLEGSVSKVLERLTMAGYAQSDSQGSQKELIEVLEKHHKETRNGQKSQTVFIANSLKVLQEIKAALGKGAATTGPAFEKPTASFARPDFYKRSSKPGGGDELFGNWKDVFQPKEEKETQVVGSAIPGVDLPGFGKGAEKAGKAGKAAGVGGGFMGKAARFMGGKGGVIGAGVLGAIGGGIVAYDRITEAQETEEAAKEQAREDLAAGKITSAQYNKQIQQASDKATISKAAGAGEGLGMFGGAMAGAKAGAVLGTAFGGPIGTVVGGLAGGALGAFGGSKVGSWLGEKVGGLFTSSTPESTTKQSGSFSVNQNGQTTTGEMRDGKYYINGQEVTEKEYQMTREKLGVAKSTQKGLDLLSGKTSVFDNVTPGSTPASGPVLNRMSLENKELTAPAPAQPTVINNVTNNNGGQGGGGSGGIIPLKPTVRPDQSTLTRYLDRVAAY